MSCIFMFMYAIHRVCSFEEAQASAVKAAAYAIQERCGGGNYSILTLSIKSIGSPHPSGAVSPEMNYRREKIRRFSLVWYGSVVRLVVRVNTTVD